MAFLTRARCIVSDMSGRRVLPGALLCALQLACGERTADPVIALPAAPVSTGGSAPVGDGGAGASANGTGGDPDASAGAGSEPTDPDLQGPVGLCAPCTSSSECGDANDACIRHQDTRFCGRDCDEQRGCPDGYTCVQLDNSPLQQCVPFDGCPEPQLATPALTDLRPYVLGRINTERAARDRMPLVASSCLDDLAQASAVDFARTDEPLGKFVKECDPVWPNCVCGWSSESEVAIARYGLDWSSAIDRAFSPRDTETDRFIQAFSRYDISEVGIGFWLSGDEAWLALSFH